MHTFAFSVSRIDSTGIRRLRTLEHHEQVVKCVQWRDCNVLASSGNDKVYLDRVVLSCKLIEVCLLVRRSLITSGILVWDLTAFR